MYRRHILSQRHESFGMFSLTEKIVFRGRKKTNTRYSLRSEFENNNEKSYGNTRTFRHGSGGKDRASRISP